MSLDWRLLPPMSCLRAFDAMARHGDFAAAARALNVTHAAVAQQVRALEKHIGVSLAVRKGRSVSLTPAGQALSRSFLEGFDTIAEGLSRLQDHQTRRGIRITATPFMVDRVITPNLAKFWDMHPEAEISIHPAREFVDIHAEGFDLGIRVVPLKPDPVWPELELEPIATAHVIGVAAPKCLQKAGGDPQAMPWLEHEGMATKLMLMRECGLNLDSLTFAPIGSPNLLLEAVRTGIGATLFSEHFTREDLAAGRLVQIRLPKPLYGQYIAATPKGPRHRLVDPFIDWLRGLF